MDGELLTAGYSGTALAKKLNLRDGQRVWFDGMPDSVQEEIGEYALALEFVQTPDDGIDAAHIFVTDPGSLAKKLTHLAQNLDPKGHVWVSWPKQASGVATQIGECDVRSAGLDLGLVDTKKCAVDDIWSGLKFVIRKENR